VFVRGGGERSLSNGTLEKVIGKFHLLEEARRGGGNKPNVYVGGEKGKVHRGELSFCQKM